MVLILIACAIGLAVIGVASMFLGMRDGLTRRQRQRGADAQDGMPQEVQNMPSRADGSTGVD